MNIPEIATELKQGLRSESSTQSQVTERQKKNDETAPTLSENKLLNNSSEKERSNNLSIDELEATLKSAEQDLLRNDVQLKFNVLEEKNGIQVEVVDSNGKVIRKIPDDDLIKLSKSLKNLDRGFLDKIF